MQVARSYRIISHIDTVSGIIPGMTEIQKRTFCRVCEPACGMIATVEDGRMTRLQADKSHPVSKGFVCNKGIYGLDIHNDPDRLKYPLRRSADGQYERIEWDHALSDIAVRLQQIKAEHGDSALASYSGNPGGFNTLLGPSMGSFLLQTGVRKFFGSGTQDCANKFAGSAAVFGTRTLHPLPDIDHSDFILIIGENPAVSHMSFMSISHPMGHLKEAEARGAEVVYINPRRIESAAIAGTVTQIKPDTDVYLLAAMLHAIDQGPGWHADAERHGQNLEALRTFVAGYTAERVADVVGLPAADITELALKFATAPAASVHMSTGVNMGRQGTLAYWLVHMLSLITGNLGKRGGNIYGLGFYERAAASGTSFPDTFIDTEFGTIRAPGSGQQLPGNLMADYILNPKDPIKAMFVSCGNPVLSVGGEARMREAMEALDLLVCVDIYQNATGEYADYVLPAAGAFEREDINITGLGLQYHPSVQFTEAVVPPAYERKPDWWIWESLNQAMQQRSALDETDEPDMWARVNAMLRSRGRSMDALREAGIIAIDQAEPADLLDRIQHEDGLVDCFPDIFAPSLDRMAQIFDALAAEPADQLKLITKRDAYMFNSWYANVDKLKKGRRDRNYLYMHPDDAQVRQIKAGDRVQVKNNYGSLNTEVVLTDDLRAGVVAMTHGGGHNGVRGMQTARNAPGVNCNVLLPSGPDSFEPLSSQAHMTGVNVEVTPA